MHVCFLLCVVSFISLIHNLLLTSFSHILVTISPVYYFIPRRFPYSTPTPVKLVLDSPPPNGFTVHMFATHASFTPNSISFSPSGIHKIYECMLQLLTNF